MDPNNLIALVNDNDEICGYAPKSEVHAGGLLHRAFSIQVIHPQKGFLLQKRASTKYHSPGLITNTCCSHLPVGFTMDEIVHVRLLEEMGFDCQLSYVDSFRYKAQFGNGLTENEIDHVYVGIWDGIPVINPEEADEYLWIMPDEVKRLIADYPERFTVWFPMVFEKIRSRTIEPGF
ncbi:MAG TPA: isopentenyl-diphosphate Delta-isomerase [Bacteroidales bacterium]|nr:isopentenyl-diphosphate Delta-isomerase [Bacteroidales bacterium]